MGRLARRNAERRFGVFGCIDGYLVSRCNVCRRKKGLYFFFSRRFGVIEREGKKLYRYRAKDYRIYFAKTDEGIKVHRVLHKNTFRDFLFRSKLPVSEDAQLGETREFWKLIEQGEKTRRM